MNTGLYQPFEKFEFKQQACFLSGAMQQEQLMFMPILPLWLRAQAGLSGEEQIKLLDESIRSYDSLNMPVDQQLYEKAIQPLESKMEAAFAQGYAGVKALEPLDLFNWLGKTLYGFVYIEMQAAVRQFMGPEGFNMSQSLILKLSNLHRMLQNLCTAMEFEHFSPYSIQCFRLKDADTDFSFKDEINTLTFSLKFKDFGIVACLQDNGTNARYHEAFLKSILQEPLSAQQFEEVAARFYYSAYLFNRLPEYAFMPVEGVVYVEAMPLRGSSNTPLFDAWQHKTYAQVLENFWKPWGYTLFEILKNPEAPMSFFVEPHLPAVH